MKNSPLCVQSKQRCEKICINNNCKICPFICTFCQNCYCQKLHTHGGSLNIIYWNDLYQDIEKVNQYILNEEWNLNVKYINGVIKQNQKLYEYLNKVKQNYQKKIKQFKGKNSVIKNQLFDIKQIITNNKSTIITGKDISMFHDQVKNDSFPSDILQKQIEKQTIKMRKLYQQINNLIYKYLENQKQNQPQPQHKPETQHQHQHQHQPQPKPQIITQKNNQSQQKKNIKINKVSQSQIKKPTIKIKQTSNIKPSSSVIVSVPKKQQQVYHTSQIGIQNKKQQKMIQEQQIAVFQQQLKQANSYFLTKKYKEAQQKYKQLNKVYPDNQEIIYKIAQISYKNKQHIQTLKYLKLILDKNPRKHECLFLSGETFKQFGDEQSALNYYIKALSYCNKNTTYLQNIINLYIKQNNHQKAKQYLNRLILIDFKYEYAMKRIQIYKQQNDLQSAEKDINQLMNKFPQKLGEISYQYGQILQKMNLDEKAIDQYTRGIVKSSLACYEARGMLNLKMQNFKKSIADFNKYISINQKNSNIYYQKALAQKKLQNLKQALISITQAVKIDLNIQYLELKHRLEQAQGQLEDAEQTKMLLNYMKQNKQNENY